MRALVVNSTTEPTPRSLALIRQRRDESIDVKRNFSPSLDAGIAHAAEVVRSALNADGRVFACGNGGSAADAQHFVAELVVRYETDRRAWPAMALTSNSSVMTAAANDYAYERVFARQVEGWAKRGDVLLAISTSGQSANVIEAARVARDRAVTVIGLTGQSSGALGEHCDVVLGVPSTSTARIQESHILILHLICELVDLT